MRTLILLLFLAAQAFSQPGAAWVTRISGPGEANAIAVAPHGPLYAGGSWQGTGTSGLDMYLARLDRITGDTVWTRYYRSANADKIQSIALIDSDVVAVGQSNNQYTVLHYRADGSLRHAWRDVLHLTTGSYANAVCTDETGAAYVTGNANDLGSSYNIITMKFSPAGDSLWQRYYYDPAGAVADLAYGIAVDESHNCYVAGVSGSNILTIKLTSAGDTVWTRRYHGPAAGSDAGYAVALDKDGNVYVAGETNITGAKAACVLSYSPAGTLRFAKTYASPAKLGDSFSAIAIDGDQNVIAVGTARTGQYLQATLTAKYSSGGDSIWARTYRPTTADASLGAQVALDTAGNIFVTGQSRTGDFDVTTLAYGPSGSPSWDTSYSGAGSYDDYGRDIAVDDSGFVFTAAAVMQSASVSDFTVLCYTQLITSVEGSQQIPPDRPRLHQNFPNPFNPTTKLRYSIPGSTSGEPPNVRIAVYDMLGREVALLVNERTSPGTFEIRFDGSRLSSGIYFCRLTAGGFTETRSLALVR